MECRIFHELYTHTHSHDTRTALLSELNANFVNRSYWIMSPDYDMSTWPDNNTMLRWLHGQATDPLAVLMFVRLLDPAFAANNYVGATTQYILPLTNPRVQVRYQVGEYGKAARYVRITSNDNDFHIKSINVKGRELQVSPWEFAVQGTVIFSQNVINADNVLVDDDNAATGTGSGDRIIELDLGSLRTLTRVELNGKSPIFVFVGVFGQTYYNGNMRVQFFDVLRKKTFDSAEGPTALSQ